MPCVTPVNHVLPWTCRAHGSPHALVKVLTRSPGFRLLPTIKRRKIRPPPRGPRCERAGKNEKAQAHRRGPTSPPKTPAANLKRDCEKLSTLSEFYGQESAAVCHTHTTLHITIRRKCPSNHTREKRVSTRITNLSPLCECHTRMSLHALRQDISASSGWLRCCRARVTSRTRRIPRSA